jgi:hypothetical protein
VVRFDLAGDIDHSPGVPTCHPWSMIGSSLPVRGYLRPGERLLWEGRPDIWAYSMRGAWYLIPFSLLWGGFAIFWEVGVITSGAPIFFWLWGIPFVVIGLYMIFGRLVVARREAGNTMYAITDRRVLIVAGAFRRTFLQLDLRDLPASQLEERAGGLGTITLGPTVGFFRMPPGWPLGGMYPQPPAFAAIPNAAGVFETLQEAKDQARRA